MTEWTSFPDSERVTVCVVGLGYVGLPLAIEFDRSGAHVVGYDIDEETIDRLQQGEDPTEEVGADTVGESDVNFTTDPESVAVADFVLLSVPTPVDSHGNPNTEYIEAAGRTIGSHMTPGTTVVLESTIYPGATESVLLPELEDASGMTAGEEFAIGYSPERLSPGGTGRTVSDVVKLVGARREAVSDELSALYSRIIDAGIYQTPDIQTAEAAKVIENIQRDLNIALVNEVALACDSIGLETREVLDAAATKWNFHDDYEPGLVGGHCIPVDPLLLARRSENEGFSPKLILQAREINEYMPKHAAEMVIQELNHCGNVLAESDVLVLGVSYKPNVSDIRTSPVDSLISELERFDISVTVHDPHAADERVEEAFETEVQSSLDVTAYDGIVVSTAHDAYESLDLTTVSRQMAENPVLVDVDGLVDCSEDCPDALSYRCL